MRIVALICLGVMLAGCNAVTSTTPLFSSADIQGQAQFRSGVWLVEDKTCAVDTAKPIADWPDCAGAWIVHPGEWLVGRDPGKPASTWTSYKTLLVRGAPPILQIGPSDDVGAQGYIYLGVRTAEDRRARPDHRVQGLGRPVRPAAPARSDRREERGGLRQTLCRSGHRQGQAGLYRERSGPGARLGARERGLGRRRRPQRPRLRPLDQGRRPLGQAI